MKTRDQVIIAVVAALLLAGAGVWYVSRGSTPPVTTADSAPITAAGGRIQVLTNGMLSSVARADSRGARSITEQSCDRAYAAKGTIACLRPVDALTGTHLVVFDAAMAEQKSIPLTGFPNRLRVSASGRMVSWTVFVGGHSYATSGFSTRTGILDTQTGQVTDSLEEYAVTIDGVRVQAADVNFWGVTFTADDNRFYATMSTGGKRYLIEADHATRTARTLTTNVECPSLSPDGKRIAYKSAVDADPAKGWRLSVMDLATLKSTPLAETRSVDDQPAWLDDTTVAYSLQRDDGVNDVWSVPADGSGQPQLTVEGANSPAAVAS
ncbi:TolB family protein [Actinokineospora sp. HUAS TT18]|uniref:TolB family protein n=1 Tax=Actinokineospora sp. HUAS TT18 TaxID=3447451 RepID=UPI003F522156